MTVTRRAETSHARSAAAAADRRSSVSARDDSPASQPACATTTQSATPCASTRWSICARRCSCSALEPPASARSGARLVMRSISAPSAANRSYAHARARLVTRPSKHEMTPTYVCSACIGLLPFLLSRPALNAWLLVAPFGLPNLPLGGFSRLDLRQLTRQSCAAFLPPAAGGQAA